jgi:anti-sigma regulatory factor (Ser/Thr protein kinase)
MEVADRCRHLPIRDASQVGEARRTATAMARDAGLDEIACGQAGIIATELSNNLLHHAHDGVLSLRTDDASALEQVATDRGPGMGDVGQALRDGFSTRGTPGTGLGAVRRLSGVFDIHSNPGKGTVVYSRLDPVPPARAVERLTWGVAGFPATGETESGDGWGIDVGPERARMLVVDGLGHGPNAAEASRAALAVFNAHPSLGCAELMETMHRSIAGTRGAAAAIAIVDLATGTLSFCGVGNISASLVGSASRSLASHNGTVGHMMRRVQTFSYSWTPGDLLVMHSDGIVSRWSLDSYPGLSIRHPAVVAAVLARDGVRGHDDRTVLVARLEAAA